MAKTTVWNIDVRSNHTKKRPYCVKALTLFSLIQLEHRQMVSYALCVKSLILGFTNKIDLTWKRRFYTSFNVAAGLVFTWALSVACSYTNKPQWPRPPFNNTLSEKKKQQPQLSANLSWAAELSWKQKALFLRAFTIATFPQLRQVRLTRTKANCRCLQWEIDSVIWLFKSFDQLINCSSSRQIT